MSAKTEPHLAEYQSIINSIENVKQKKIVDNSKEDSSSKTSDGVSVSRFSSDDGTFFRGEIDMLYEIDYKAYMSLRDYEDLHEVTYNKKFAIAENSNINLIVECAKNLNDLGEKVKQMFKIMAYFQILINSINSIEEMEEKEWNIKNVNKHFGGINVHNQFIILVITNNSKHLFDAFKLKKMEINGVATFRTYLDKLIKREQRVQIMPCFIIYLDYFEKPVNEALTDLKMKRAILREDLKDNLLKEKEAQLLIWRKHYEEARIKFTQFENVIINLEGKLIDQEGKIREKDLLIQNMTAEIFEFKMILGVLDD
jgi:hypothetical protein